MKEGWEIKTLGEVCKVVGGGTPSKNRLEFYGGTINWASVRDLNSETLLTTEHTITTLGLQNSSTNLIPKNNVIFASRVGLGKVCITKIDVAINQDLRAPIPKNPNQLDVVYLFRWFQNRRDIIIKAGQGATVQGITLPFINNLKIPIPPLSEQQRIVSIIDEAFEAIDKAIENTQKNLQNAKELFESYLNSVFENGGANWEEKTLKEVCAKITDGTHQTPKYFDDGVIFLSSRNVTSGKIDWDNIKYIDEKQHLEMHKRVAPRVGDILLAKNGTTGVAAIVDRDLVFDIYVSLAHIRVLDQVTPEFMLYFINSPLAKKQFNKRLKGSGVPNLHLEEIREVSILFPKSKSKQKSIVEQLDAMKAETQRLELMYNRKNCSLEELKKSVLNKAFAGEL
jgi:type I restriction enzyme S subunit